MVKLKHKKNQLYKELTVTKEPPGGSYKRLDIFNITRNEWEHICSVMVVESRERVKYKRI